jgi:serine/threonine protein phosphatase PrpC
MKPSVPLHRSAAFGVPRQMSTYSAHDDFSTGRRHANNYYRETATTRTALPSTTVYDGGTTVSVRVSSSSNSSSSSSSTDDDDDTTVPTQQRTQVVDMDYALCDNNDDVGQYTGQFDPTTTRKNPHGLGCFTTMGFVMDDDDDDDGDLPWTEGRPHGFLYKGDWTHGRRNGRGVQTWANHFVYDGEWKEGQQHGQGVFLGRLKDKDDNVHRSSGRCRTKELYWFAGQKYNGTWHEDQRHGHGIAVWTDGETYDGAWKRDLRHGNGLNTWPNGNTYHGEWQDDKRNGNGVNRWSSEGLTYVGEWYQDRRHGMGVFTDDKTGNVYDGEWNEDRRHGRGAYTDAKRSVYEGEWKEDKRHGLGVFTDVSGNMYEGEWKWDKPNGRGVFVEANGNTYCGEWNDDNRHGRGVYTDASGNTYEGEWKEDKRNGYGVYTDASGNTNYGEWKDDIGPGDDDKVDSDSAIVLNEIRVDQVQGLFSPLHPVTDQSPKSYMTNRLGTIPVSVCSICGERDSMEDEVFTAVDLFAVFDGHGGAKVSQYLRQNLYAEVQAALLVVMTCVAEVQRDRNGIVSPAQTNSGATRERLQIPWYHVDSIPDSHHVNDPFGSGNGFEQTGTAFTSTPPSGIMLSQAPTVEEYVVSLRRALKEVDEDVLRMDNLRYQGSTVVAAWVHESKPELGADAADTKQKPPIRTLIVANIGDSRAVLSRNKSSVDLTRDHKPNDRMERKRIDAAGGSVEWDGLVDVKGDPFPGTGMYRVNGSLTLSRAIGDRFARPAVTAEPDIIVWPLQDETDDFVVLATDGLWDVMSSSEVVSFIHSLMNSEDGDSIATMLVEEALRRGSYDNISVTIVWLSSAHKTTEKNTMLVLDHSDVE